MSPVIISRYKGTFQEKIEEYVSETSIPAQTTYLL
jgi:hypothetical protein